MPESSIVSGFRHAPLLDGLGFRIGRMEPVKDLFDTSKIIGHEDEYFLNRALVRNVTIPSQKGLGLFVNWNVTDHICVRTVACAANLRTFSTAFEMYASQNVTGYRCSSAFDYRRDGDVRTFGWVADVINLRVGNPGKMLCPSNTYTINEKVADCTGAAQTGSDNPNQHPGGQVKIPIVPVGPPEFELREFWAKGYNSNYATTWHFSRNDPTAKDGYGSDGNPNDPKKCPLDGDGPLNEKHLSQGGVSPDRIALMGDARAGDSGDSEITQPYADKINQFADKEVARVGEYTVESFCDGMSVDYSEVTGDHNRQGHEFNDIVPLHDAGRNLVGGFANILFVDGHVNRVYDTGGQLGYYGDPRNHVDDVPDGFLGPYKTRRGFRINETGFSEIRQLMWYGRLRPRALPGGGSIK